MSDTFAYKFEPAGHEEPEKLRHYAQPGMKLKQAFETWLQDLGDSELFLDGFVARMDEHYERALRLVNGLELSVGEANGLLMQYKDHPQIKYVGLFVSAIYNLAPEKEIVFDVDVPVKELGHKLPRNKIFINKQKLSGEDIGWNCEASIVNFGTLEDYGHASPQAGAPLVNYGSVDLHMYSSCAIANYGKIGYLTPCHAIANFGEIDGLSGRKENVEVLKCDGSCESYKHPVLIVNLGKAVGAYECSKSDIPHSGEQVLIAARNPPWSNVRLVFDRYACAKLPELQTYMSGLRQRFEAGRNDYHAALAALNGLGQTPRTVIGRDIAHILKRAGQPLRWNEKEMWTPLNVKLASMCDSNGVPKSEYDSKFNEFLREAGYEV